MSMCLLRLPLLLFLAKKTAAKLSKYILNGLEIESTILSLDMKLFNHTPYDVCSLKIRNELSLHSKSSNQILLCTSLRYNSTGKQKNLFRC